MGEDITGRLGLEASLEKAVLFQGKGASRPTGSALVAFHVGELRIYGQEQAIAPSDDRLGDKSIMPYPLQDTSMPVLYD